MKLLNKNFSSIEEIADFVKNHKDVREKWRRGDIIVTLDKEFQITIKSQIYGAEESFKIKNLLSGRKVGFLYVEHVEYLIEKFNPEANLSIARRNMYMLASAIVKMFDSVLIPGDMFVYNQPCDGMGGYDIYAIANVNGIIMAEFISNSTKSRGSDEHEIGTKGLESLAIMEAWQKYHKGEGVMKHVAEYVNAGIDLII